jgi:micrococcal nuclease
MLRSIALAGVLLASPALADHPYDVRANNRSGVRVIDGDTIQFNKTKVRAVGYDTPEKGALAKCNQEGELAARATSRFTELVRPPHVFTLKWAKGKDKYGRSLALFYSDHQEIGKILINEGLARPYDGGQRQSWCN